MLTLQCEIRIHNIDSEKTVRFNYANSIVVKTSCKNLTDTATVKVPKKMSWNGKPLTDYVKRNDEISIRVGYKEYGLETVFKGYVSRVENSTPIVIECENEMRLFKTITVKAEIIKNFNIKNFIQKYAPNVEVVGPDIDFGTVTIEEQNLSQALDKLMSSFSWFKGFFRDGKFIAVIDLAAIADSKTFTFDPERNMISDQLKYTLSEDVKIAVKAVHINRDNTKIEVVFPEEAKSDNNYEQRQFFFPEYDSEHQLKEAAENTQKSFVCDKMEGNITAFGIPFVKKCDIVLLKDKQRKERDGKRFWVNAVDYSFGTGGYRQTITLGDQLH